MQGFVTENLGFHLMKGRGSRGVVALCWQSRIGQVTPHMYHVGMRTAEPNTEQLSSTFPRDVSSLQSDAGRWKKNTVFFYTRCKRKGSSEQQSPLIRWSRLVGTATFNRSLCGRLGSRFSSNNPRGTLFALFEPLQDLVVSFGKYPSTSFASLSQYILIDVW